MAGPGDFNGDGKVDIVRRNYATGGNVVWFMNETEFKSATSLPTLADTAWAVMANATADFDGDGKADRVWRNYATGDNDIWLMEGTAPKREAPLFALADLNWKCAGLADFDQDVKLDLVWRHALSEANADGSGPELAVRAHRGLHGRPQAGHRVASDDLGCLRHLDDGRCELPIPRGAFHGG
jgi:hypothetical protein